MNVLRRCGHAATAAFLGKTGKTGDLLHARWGAQATSVSLSPFCGLGGTRLSPRVRAPRVRRLPRRVLAVGLSWLCSFSLVPAQQAPIEPVRPVAPVVWRPYLAVNVPPVRLANSPRLRELVRAGKLYLTAQDAIALALENNIDVEVARYNPLVAAWQVERAQAGGALPGVPSSASQAGAVASGQGVSGSQAAAGVSGGPSTASTAGSGNASIAQIGPVTQTLDPTFQETSTFSHKSAPQPNTIQSGIFNLVDNTRVYSGSLQEGFLSGGSATVKDAWIQTHSPAGRH